MGASPIFQIPTPFLADEVRDLGYEETADVMIITHPNHPPQALRRYGHNVWTLGDAVFASTTAPPTGATATAHSSTAGQPIDHIYKITAVDDVTGRESLPTAATAPANIDLGVDVNNYVSVAWTPPAGASICNIYEALNGVYGFLGTSGNGTFRDNNIAADLSDGPPQTKNPFIGADNYPAEVTFFQQRAVFARTNAKPNGVFGSRSGDFFNMNVSFPPRADDAFTEGLVAREVNIIQHLVPLKVLLCFTDSQLFSLTGPQTGILSPVDFQAVPQNYRGASPVRPAVVDDITFYNTAKGNQIRTVGYQFAVDGYRGNDITVFAPHLFKNRTTQTMAFAFSPTSTLFTVRDDGQLACLTWQAEQDVWGWSLCYTDGTIDDVIVVTENGEDVPYFVVYRQIGGKRLGTIERLASPDWGGDVSNAVFLDASVTFSGAKATHFDGMHHLEGRDVGVLADGAVFTGHSIQGGVLTPDLPLASNIVTIGLAYEGWVHTLPSVTQAPGIGSTEGRRQIIATAYLALIKTRGIEVAPGRLLLDTDPDTSDASASGKFYPVKFRTPSAVMGDPPAVLTGLADVDVSSGDWSEATLVIRQRQPLPFTLTGVFPDIAMGG